MSDWPEHSDELARKVLTVAHDRMHQCLVENQFDQATLKLILRSLYDTVEGLVSFPDCADVLVAILQEIEK